VQEIKIRGEMIRLGQLLKLGGVVETGGDGKDLLATGAVLVNSEVETRRGRQLHDGDVVEVEEWEFRVSADGASGPRA
jgi:ribosome-associated protein